MKRNTEIFKRFLSITVAALLVIPTFAAPASAAMPALDKTFTLYMVPNTHLDTAWQHTYKQVAEGNGTSNGIRYMFNNAINKLNSDSSFVFTTSASKHYEWVKEYYDSDNPDGRQYWPEVKRLVESGQWDITGGQVVEPDLNLPSGESFARQSLYAQHFFEKEFGWDKQPKTGMVPDVFGFAGQIPQVLFKSEMPYFVTSKINWSGTTGLSAYKEDPESGTNAWRNHRGNDDIGTTRRGREADIWWWQGLDEKTSVLSNFLTYDYNWQSGRGPLENVFEQNWQDGYETGIKIGLFFYGGGDFGQGLTATTGSNSFSYVNEVAADTNTKFNVVNKGTTGFFTDLMDIIKDDEAAVADGEESTLNIPTHTGEIYLEYHRGTYTSWARIKKYNRDNEVLGESAEKAATLGFYTGSLPSNSSDKIEWAWNRVLTDQMHDVIPGSSVAHQYYMSYNFQEQSANLFNNVRDNALGALSYRADTNVVGKPVFVYNELSWVRDGEVTVDLKYDVLPPGIRIFDGDKELFASKVVKNEADKILTVTFMAKDVPSVGYKVFDIREGVTPAHTTTLNVDAANLTFENEYIKMRINPATGYISSLRHNEGGNWREVFAQGVGTEGAELHVYRDTDERPDQGFDQWDLIEREMNKEPEWIVDGAPLSLDIIENTPDKVTVRVVKVWNGCEIAQEYTMYPGVDRVDVNLNAEWYTIKRLLKVSFPIDADNDYATYETAFGAVERPTDRITPFQIARYEVPGHKWIDVTDKSGEYGVSILNDAKYGFDSLRKTVEGKTFIRSRITACRTPRAQSFASNSSYTPSSPYVIDSREHNFNYSIAPHSGGWESSNTVNKGYAFNSPMEAFEAAKTPSNGLGSSESFASVNKANVVMSALKNQHDDQTNKNKLIVRVYEATGKDTNGVTITLPGNVISAKEVNILEHNYDAAHGYEGYATKNIARDGKTISFDIGKYEILTIEAEVEAFAQAPLGATPQKSVDLSSYYNRRATSPRSDRRAAFVEGDGTSASPGFSMPEKNWPADGINYQGIKFSVGPKDGNNLVSSADGVKVNVANPSAGYSKVYIVGFSTARTLNTISGTANNGACSATGSITVNYTDASPTAKNIKFSSWRTDLSGWDRYSWKDTRPYVYDTIVHVNTFFQQSTSTTANVDHFTNENFLFLYAIDVDKTKAINSIDLPANSDIKIVSVTLADPVPGFGVVYDGAEPEKYTDSKPAAPTNVDVKYEPSSNNLRSLITWDNVDNAAKYKVYGSKTKEFTVGTSTLLGETGNTSFVHAMPIGVSPADAEAGNDKYYYKVVASSRTSADSDPSEVSNSITISNIDYCVGITNGVANTAIVNQGGQQSTTLAGWKATSGVWSTLNDKWSHNNLSNGTGWLSVRVGHDGELKEIQRFILVHGNITQNLNHNGSNRMFSIWYSNDSSDGSPDDGTWTMLFDETNNYADVSVHELKSSLEVDWVQVRIPPGGGYAAPTGGSGYTFNIAWLYEFCAVTDNPNINIARAENTEISFTPDVDNNTTALEVVYDYSSPADGSAEGATTYKWFKKFADGYNTVYVPIPDASGKTLAQTNVEIGETVGYKCEVTLFDSKGNKGEKFNVEVESPLSTITNAKIVSAVESEDVTFELSYDYYNALNFDSDGEALLNPPKEDAAKYQWYKKTDIKVDGKFVAIPGETGKRLSQDISDVLDAEAYRCEVSVYDTDGAKGKVVNVDVNTWVNRLFKADVVSAQSPGNPALMVDGLITTKWEVATASNPCPHEAVFDMGSVKTIDRFKVYNAPSNPTIGADMTRYSDLNLEATTYDFDLYYSKDNETWSDPIDIRRNTAAITDIKLPAAVEAQYVKIVVITPNRTHLALTNFWDPTNRIRIPQFEALANMVTASADSVTLLENGKELNFASAVGKTVDVNVKVSNMQEGEINLIAAVYNDDGSLLSIAQVPVSINDLGVVDCTISNFAVSQDAAMIKTFFWAADTQIPVRAVFPVN